MSLYQQLHSLLAPWIRQYTRLEVRGIENLPSGESGALLACNHAGNLWWDAICLIASISDRQLHFIAHHWDATIPPVKLLLENLDNYFLSPSLKEITPDDAVVQSLRKGQLMCQYPEESYHTFWQRYTLFRFSPQIVKYAYLAEVPIIPVAVIGVEEASPTLLGIKRPGIPLHIPLHLPFILPLKITIEFGQPYSVKKLIGQPHLPQLLDATAYQKGADSLRRHLQALISQYRTCHLSELRYVEKSGLF